MDDRAGEAQRPLRWWMAGGAMPGGGRELLGKPPVFCRKTVNAVAADGCQVSFFRITGVCFCLHSLH